MTVAVVALSPDGGMTAAVFVAAGPSRVTVHRRRAQLIGKPRVNSTLFHARDAAPLTP